MEDTQVYGTVAKLKLKPGSADQFKQLMSQYKGLEIPGFVTDIVYRSDDDPNEYFVSVVFNSREDYVANAESPEQHERFTAMSQLLAAEPEWHDGEIVYYDVA